MEEYIGSQREEFARALVHVMISHGCEVDGIVSLLRYEVEKATNHKILFRGNSITTKVLDQYMKIVGSHYLYSTLHAILEHLYSLNESFEVDPSRINSKKGEDKEKQSKKNMKGLLTNVEAVTYAIFKSSEKFPPYT